MMDLVLEQVQQQAIRALRLHPYTAVHLNNLVGGGFVQSLAPGD